MLRKTFAEHKEQATAIARNLFSLFGIRILQRGLGLVTVYIMVRTLSQHEFGNYQFMLSLLGALAIFNLNGLDNAVMQSVSRGHTGTYRTATRLAFFSSWLGSLALIGMAAWHYQSTPVLAVAFAVAALFFPFSQGLTQWKSIVVGQERFGKLLQQESATVIAVNGLLIAALLYKITWLPALIAAYMIVPTVQNLRRTWQAWRLTAAETTSEPESIRYGLKTSAYMVISVVSEQVERLLIFFVLSPATLGIYAAADRLAELVRGAVQDFAAVLAPRFAKLNHYSKDMDKVIKLFCLVFGALIILFAFTLLPWVLTVLFGDSYAAAIPYAQALLCAVAVGNVGQFQFRFIRSQLDSDNFRRILLGASIYRILAAVVLVPLYGLWGVVGCIFSYRLVVSIISGWAVKKHYSQHGDATHA